MPAIQVARTDTFEQQRVKINQIGDQIFNVTAGGSDLSTGNLKLGDGTRTAPSLAFVSDNSLGIYKAANAIGYVASGAKLIDFSPTSTLAYKDFVIQRNVLTDAGIAITNKGTNYDAGNYSGVPLIGGTGTGGTGDIVVIAHNGTIVGGNNYTPGTYSDVLLSGGNGSDASITFDVDALEGSILDAGSAYVPGTYSDVPLTGGSGSNATANINVEGATTLVTNITNTGSGYTDGTYNDISLRNVAAATYTVTVISNPGTPPPDNVYQINGSTQLALSLTRGNTYIFDQSDASNAGHPIDFSDSGGLLLSSDYYTIYRYGLEGNPGAFVELTIQPDAPIETIQYICQVHSGMGGNASVGAGTAGNHGLNALANLTFASGALTTVDFSSSGTAYKVGDELYAITDTVGGTGGGLVIEITGITYAGPVTSVTVVQSGQDYLFGETLSAADADLGGGGGSGFQFSISSNPGVVTNVVWGERGTNYQVNDVLTLPTPTNNVSVAFNGVVSGITTTLTAGQAQLTIASTAGILPGMRVTQDVSDVGVLDSGCVVSTVDSATQVTLDLAPTGSGAATLQFESFDPANTATVSSTAGLSVGDILSKVSGDGAFPTGTTISGIDTATSVITLSENATSPGNTVVNFAKAWGVPTSAFSYTISNLGEVESITIRDGGNGYSITDTLGVSPSDLTSDISYTATFKQLQLLTLTTPVASGTFSIGDQIKKVDGEVVQITMTDPGTNLTPGSVGPLATTLSTASNTITVSNTSGISVGDRVTQAIGDTGFLAPSTTVTNVVDGTTLELSANPTGDGSANLTFTEDLTAVYTGVATTGGSGSGFTATVNRDQDGGVSGVTVVNGGSNYAISDTVTISGTLTGGASPAQDITLEVNNVTAENAATIWQIYGSGNITDILVDSNAYVDGDDIQDFPTAGSPYNIATAAAEISRLFLDIGNGEELHPNLTLYVGNNYSFDVSDSTLSGKSLSFSEFRDGANSPSRVDGVSATLSTSTASITVTSSTGILPGMFVEIVTGTGTVSENTLVETVVGNTITFNQTPTGAGPVTINFYGTEYTTGISKSSTIVRFSVTDQTPSTLYYYLPTDADAAGVDNSEAVVTVDPNNPKTFGSDFEATVNDLQSDDVITLDIETGTVTSLLHETGTVTAQVVNAAASLTTATANATNLNVQTIAAPAGTTTLNVTAATTALTGGLNVGNLVSINATSGQILTSGVLKTTGSLNIDDVITIDDNDISVASNRDLQLTPSTNRILKVNSPAAITIPSGDTSQRPAPGVVDNGSIRFNTDTNQYEGYSAASTSWSSLGGVRDLDGNTYILAEQSIGANDNTLWFYNDNTVTVKFTPTHLEFVNQKSIRSANVSAPVYSTWNANSPVSVGDYLKYKNNLYEVTTGGTTGTSGSEPTHTSGSQPNGTTVLQFWGLAVAPLVFEDIEELRVGPLGSLPLSINSDLRLAENVVSTDISDLVIRPNAGKKVVIDATSTLAIPVGTDVQRGIAVQGSIRFSTTSTQFEGYDGTNWGSLGGVKDVDQNTYIIPETSPGSNENILYFYNDGNNTAQLTTTALDFYTVDTLRSMVSDEFEITASLLTIDAGATTLDNTAADTTFLHTSKQYFDLGVSAGLTVDPILRLDNLGDVYFNTTFGTGTFTGVKVFDGDLKEFELADVKIVTEDLSLVKGTVDTVNSILYASATSVGCKTIVTAHNPTTGDKEFVEFGVIDDGADVFHTEYGNIRTGTQLIDPTFEFTANNEARLNIAIGASVAPTESVNVTVTTHITKK